MVDLLRVLELVPDGKLNMDTQTVFDDIFEPDGTIGDYIVKLFQYIIHDVEILRFIYHNMVVFSSKTRIVINKKNVRRIALACTVVSHKFWEDESLENKAMSDVVGLSVKDVNILEMEFMKGINWELHKTSAKIGDSELIDILECFTGMPYSIIKQRYNSI